MKVLPDGAHMALSSSAFTRVTRSACAAAGETIKAKTHNTSRRSMWLVLVKPHILKVYRPTFDASRRWRNPVGKFARFDDAFHQRGDEGAILVRGKPVVDVCVPLGIRNDLPLG